MKYLIIVLCVLAVLFLPNPYWIPFYVIVFVIMLNKLIKGLLR